MLDVKALLAKLSQKVSAYQPGTTTDITATSWADAWTCPSDGYVFIFTGTGTGFVSIHNVGAIGGATNNREMVFVRKGTKVYKDGTVQVARFIPLS